MESEEYMNRKSRKQRGEAEVSIHIILIIIIMAMSSYHRGPVPASQSLDRCIAYLIGSEPSIRGSRVIVWLSIWEAVIILIDCRYSDHE